MKNKIAAIASLFLCSTLIGCESSQDMFKKQNQLAQQETAQASQLGVRCEMMSRTGSNKKTKVCRTAEQMELDQQTAERTIERLQKNGPLTTSSN